MPLPVDSVIHRLNTVKPMKKISPTAPIGFAMDFSSFAMTASAVLIPFSSACSPACTAFHTWRTLSSNSSTLVSTLAISASTPTPRMLAK